MVTTRPRSASKASSAMVGLRIGCNPDQRVAVVGARPRHAAAPRRMAGTAPGIVAEDRRHAERQVAGRDRRVVAFAKAASVVGQAGIAVVVGHAQRADRESTRLNPLTNAHLV